MKKIFLSTVLAACSWCLFAQDSTMNNTSTNQMNNTTSNQAYNTTSTSNYKSYGIPNYVQMNFQTAHPYATNLMWDAPTADWYHGYYSDVNTGRYTHVYYSTDPYYNVSYYPERVTGYTVSLPVLQTWVPDAVITQASNLYKQNLYDITAMKGNNSQDVYQVRILDNGEVKTLWMDANGGSVTDVYRTDDMYNTQTTTNTSTITTTESNAAMGNTSNDVKTKTKTKYSDGTEVKTKTKNGKTKTKRSGDNMNNDQY